MNQQPRPDADKEAVPAEEDGPKAGVCPSVSSDSLLRGQKAVTISHNGSIYRLQATRQGKLILTK
jgi:hemin uptake protein HemP